MLKVGDKVRIRRDLILDKFYGSYPFVCGMEHFKGKIATITKVYQNGTAYSIDIDGRKWAWSADMLKKYRNTESGLTVEEYLKQDVGTSDESSTDAPEDKTNDPLASGTLMVMTPEKHQAAHRRDMVNHPPHYTKRGIETIELIKNGVEDFPSYCTGNIIKYVSRYLHKNGVEDLKKAKWYLERLIEEESKND